MFSAHRLFGGAGVSTESGIPDFRSVDGLYHQQYDYPPEQILSRGFFDENPAEFYRFYRNKMLCPNARPNAAHYKLAELEQAGKCTAVVTQNIDGLHQARAAARYMSSTAPSLRNHCMRCGRAYGVEAVAEAADIPRCACGGIIKPDVVLYEEGLDQQTVEGAVHAIARADCMIVAGTSLSVYPAAGFIRYFQGEHFVLINRDPTPADKLADLVFAPKGGAGAVPNSSTLTEALMPISVMLKPASGNCNLRCEYCFYHDLAATRQTENKGYMTRDTALQVMDKALAFAGDGPVYFTFQGGEPLLAGKDFFRFFFSSCKERRRPA